jgi:hypothetical protein
MTTHRLSPSTTETQTRSLPLPSLSPAPPPSSPPFPPSLPPSSPPFPCLSQNVMFEVWDCHWSPRLFKVQGQLAWAIPPLATEPLLFALSAKSSPSSSSSVKFSSLLGKIAVVRRGEIPLVFKILNLQVPSLSPFLPPSAPVTAVPLSRCALSLRGTELWRVWCWILRTVRSSDKPVSQDRRNSMAIALPQLTSPPLGSSPSLLRLLSLCGGNLTESQGKCEDSGAAVEVWRHSGGA